MPDIVFPNLGLTLENINTVAFSVFGIEIYWYAICVVLGIIAGVYFGAVFAPKRTGQDPNVYMDFALFVVPACIIGARLFYVIFAWDATWTFARIFDIRQGGLAIYGVVIAAIITALIFCKVKKINFFHFADTGIVGLIIGHAIGRIGNFINREAFGGYYTGFFAMEIRLDQVHNLNTVTEEMRDNFVMRGGIEYISVHPTFLYEAITLVVLFIALNLYRKHKKFNGEILAYYFLVYGVVRFFIEGLRTDQLLLSGTNLSVSMIMSAVIAVLGLIMLAHGYAKHFTKPKSAKA
ncbi:MAG: prolipoprotein diacylglyceryl transferase [Defluviitaleaceae bacterium]|nr:prolipoprotein diacylglyceryl transferase [Defluviitaleaceae bacterium]